MNVNTKVSTADVNTAGTSWGRVTSRNARSGEAPSVRAVSTRRLSTESHGPQQVVEEAGSAEHREEADRDEDRRHDEGEDRHRPEKRPAGELEAGQQVGPREPDGDAHDRREQRLIRGEPEQPEVDGGHAGVDPRHEPARYARRIGNQRVCRTGIERIAKDGDERVNAESAADGDGAAEHAADGVVEDDKQRPEHGGDPDRQQSGRRGPHAQSLTIWRAHSSIQPPTFPTSSS